MLRSNKFHKESNSSKWTFDQNEMIYALTLADMDLPFFAPFKQQFEKSMHKINNLTYKNRSEAYLSSICKWLNNKYIKDNTVQKIKFHHIVESPSICNLYAVSLLAFLSQNDSAIIMNPVYDFYSKSTKVFNRRIISTNVKKINNADGLFTYDLDLEDMQQKIRDKKNQIKLVCLAHPHNPTGKVWSKSTIKSILQLCQKYDLFLWSDEILADLCFQFSQFYSLLNSDYSKLIVGNSISKAFNCSSIQGGYGIIKNKEIRQRYQNFAQKGLKLLTNEIAIIMIPIAYSKIGQLWLNEVYKLIKLNYQTIIQFSKINLPKLIIYSLEAAYLVVIDFHAYVVQLNKNKLNGMKQLEQRMKAYSIKLLNMNNYYQPSQITTQMRVSIAVDPYFLKLFLNQLSKMLNFTHQFL